MLDTVPGGIVTLSTDLRIVSANAAMATLVERDAAELPGTTFDALLSGPSRILFQTHVAPALHSQGYVEEVFLTLAGGGLEATPVVMNIGGSQSGPEAAYVALVVRIPARARWEKEVLAAHRAAEAAREDNERLARELAAAAEDLAARFAAEQRSRERRDAFIGVVSHELRTPITTIFGMSQILGRRYRSMDPDAVGQYLDDIEGEADRLRRLAEDLLVLSRAEAGRLQLVDEPVVVSHVVRRAVDGERARWPSRRFVFDAPTGVALVAGEELAVEQVARNLLSNAAKYSSAGSAVRAKVFERDGGVVVQVLDRGAGIPEDAGERLFELFYRAPGAVRHISGAGIGLFVCRELIEAMGGRVWARQRPGGGAEFGFWLPALDVEAEAIEHSEALVT